MATNKHGDVQIIEKNEGTNIALQQIDYKLIFGDDELSIRCDKYQRDWPVHLDVCADDNNNLVVGVGVGRYYVGQIDIPATVYHEVPDPEPMAIEEDGAGTQRYTKLEPEPLNMGDVIVTLWSIDDITITPAELA